MGVAIIDRQFRFRSVNETLARINCTSQEAHIGKPVGEVLGDFASKIQPVFERVLATGAAISNFEVGGTLLQRKATGKWIEDWFPLKDRKGRVQQVLAMIIEVPPSKMSELDLEPPAQRHNTRDKEFPTRNVSRNSAVASDNDNANQSRQRHSIETGPGSNSPLFRNIDRGIVNSVVRCAKRVKHAPGELFCRQEQPATDMYLLAAGQAKAIVYTRSGREVLLSWLYPGDVFGLGSLLSTPMHYLWTVRAVVESEALAWGSRELKSLAPYAPLHENALAISLNWANEMQERIEDLSTEKVEQRLARLLLRLPANKSEGVPGIAATDEEFAQMVGSNLYTVSRIFTRWHRSGYVEKGRRRLLVLSREHLFRLSTCASLAEEDAFQRSVQDLNLRHHHARECPRKPA